MKSQLLYLFSLLLPLVAAAGDAAPGDSVKAALDKLQAASGYAWRITMSSGGQSRFSPGPVEGKTVKNNGTHWAFAFGERSAEAWVKDGHFAVKTDEGWCRPEDLPKPPPAPPPSPPDARSRRDDHGGKPPHERGKKAGFLIKRLQSMKLPGDFAADLVAKTSNFRQNGETITGELSGAAARELLTFGSHRRDKQEEFADPRGTVTWLIRDGVLVQFDLQLAATFSVNGSAVPIERSSRIEIRDVGTTSLTVPDEAAKLLALPSPSDKQPAAPAVPSITNIPNP